MSQENMTVFEDLPIGAWFVVMGDETQEVLQKIEVIDGTAEDPLGYNARSLSGDHYWVVGRAVVEVREVGYVGELAEVDFTPPTKKELLDQWVIATNKAITALTDWRDTLTRWAADEESITDPTFMSAYGKLTNVVGYWADDALWDDYNIDRLREALTGVDPAYGLEPAVGDEFVPYVSGFMGGEPIYEPIDYSDCASEEGGLERGIDPILWAEETESEYI